MQVFKSKNKKHQIQGDIDFKKKQTTLDSYFQKPVQFTYVLCMKYFDTDELLIYISNGTYMNFFFVLSYKFSELLIYHVDPDSGQKKLLFQRGY